LITYSVCAPFRKEEHRELMDEPGIKKKEKYTSGSTCPFGEKHATCTQR
jgi:hypothetical protein